jgi:hypothetical protein
MPKRKEGSIDKRNKKSPIFARFVRRPFDEKWIIYMKLSSLYLKDIFKLEKDDIKRIKILCDFIHERRIGDPRVWIAAIFYYNLKNYHNYINPRRRFVIPVPSRREILANFFGINADWMTQKANEVARIVKEKNSLENNLNKYEEGWEPDYNDIGD